MGLIARTDEVQPPNNPPEWTGTPNPTAVAGISATYEMADDTHDQEGDTLFYSENDSGTIFPVWLTISGSQLIIDNQTTEGIYTGFIVDVRDTDSAKIASNTFSIIITADDVTLAENTVNLFLDPDNGSDSYNGLYGEFSSGSNGPKKTWGGITTLNLTSMTGVWMLAGTKTTGEQFYNETDFLGSDPNYAVVGAYYLSGSTPKRGLGGNARPIVEGTAARPVDYDGSNAQIYTNLEPTPGPTSINFGAMIGLGSGSNGDAFLRIENMHARHAGSAGFRAQDWNHIQYVNCYSELCMGPVAMANGCTDVLIENCYGTGCAFGQQYFGHNTHSAVISVKECTDVVIRGNVIWQCWGEMIDVWNGCERVLCEDNIVFDGERVCYYIDATHDGVWRRNLGFKTGKGVNGYSTFQHREGFSLNSGERFQFTTPDTGSLSWDAQNKDLMIYSNIMIGCESLATFWAQAANWAGSSYRRDSNAVWIFNNTVIDCATEYNAYNDDWLANDGKVHDNMHLTFQDTAHNIHSVFPIGTWVFDNNSWNGVTGAPGWTGDLTAAWSGDTANFNVLHTLATWSADGHIEIENVDAFITAVKAKLGLPTGVNIGGGSVNAHATEITVTTYDGLDFYGNSWSTNDVGAIAA